MTTHWTAGLAHHLSEDQVTFFDHMAGVCRLPDGLAFLARANGLPRHDVSYLIADEDECKKLARQVRVFLDARSQRRRVKQKLRAQRGRRGYRR